MPPPFGQYKYLAISEGRIIWTIERETNKGITNHSRILLDPIIVSDTINYVNSDVFELPDNINSDHDAEIKCTRL
jgi:HD-like signal output (HDOD) protein